MGERGGLFWWSTASIAAVVLGSFGPWAKVGALASISGVDGSNDGWFGLVVAAIAAIVLFRRRGGRTRGLLLAALGGVLAAAAFYDRRHVEHLGGFVQVGWGLNLMLAAAISLLLAGLAEADLGHSLLRRSSLEDAPARCSSCGASAHPQARTCGNCGASLRVN